MSGGHPLAPDMLRAAATEILDAADDKLRTDEYTHRDLMLDALTAARMYRLAEKLVAKEDDAQ
jgi:hypothetical protein